MTWRRVWPILLLVLGGILVLVGLLLVGAYVYSAVIERAGEPDQSLLFWYSPFLFAGLISAIMGAAAGIGGILAIRRGK